MPRGMTLGRVVPDLCAPSDVVFSMAGRRRSRDGRNTVRSARSQSFTIIRDATCEFVGSANTVVFAVAQGVACSFAFSGCPVGLVHSIGVTSVTH